MIQQQKIMLIGKTGCGKTTLAQKLNNEEIKYKKTQAVAYKSKIIDTPGEYIETKFFYKSLLVLSVDAEIIILIQAANNKETIFPPNFSTMFPKKDIIGVITKVDIESETYRSENILLEAGVSEIFKIGMNDKEGLELLKKRLGFNEEKS